ncbi:MAG: hypothetical protein D3924_05820 [Candidatus Electrothrix sp. AR4]|nr:hypothetical protein [Candidatus Electrothrix sp. AR4]
MNISEAEWNILVEMTEELDKERAYYKQIEVNVISGLTSKKEKSADIHVMRTVVDIEIISLPT